MGYDFNRGIFSWEALTMPHPSRKRYLLSWCIARDLGLPLTVVLGWRLTIRELEILEGETRIVGSLFESKVCDWP
jgi:hypothetical protein